MCIRDRVRAAGAALASVPESSLLCISSMYRTAPVGIRGQPDFINAVAALTTALAAEKLLDALFAVERRFGRRREFRHAPRTLDLDPVSYTHLDVYKRQVVEWSTYDRLRSRILSEMATARLDPSAHADAQSSPQCAS